MVPLIFEDGSPVSLDPWSSIPRIERPPLSFATTSPWNEESEAALAQSWGFEIEKERHAVYLHGDRNVTEVRWRFPDGRELARPLGDSYVLDASSSRAAFFESELLVLTSSGEPWLTNTDLYMDFGVNRYLFADGVAFTPRGCWVALSLATLENMPTFHAEAERRLGSAPHVLFVDGVLRGLSVS